MPETIQMPTCGRMVHYFPDRTTNDFIFVSPSPAIVIAASGENELMLSVFSASESRPVVLRAAVPHMSAKKSGANYWDWPEIKKQ